MDTKAKEEKVVVIVLPGASGKLSKALKAFIDTVKTETLHEDCKWTTANPAARSNFEIINRLVAKLDPETKFYIVANSFSNRVVCQYLQNEYMKLESRLKGVVFVGYPLWGKVASKPRKEYLSLKPLVGKLKFKFVSGTKDEFLNRSFLDAGSSGIHGLDSVKKDLKLEEDAIVLIDGGRHSLPDATKSEVNHVTLQFRRIFVEFCVT